MKKLILTVFTVFSLMACTTDDDSNGDTGGSGISNNPLSGKLFGADFTADEGRADLEVVFNNESVVIRLGVNGEDCETGAFSGAFPIQITAPRAEGNHTSGVYVLFRDPNSSDFVSVSSGNEVEIISLTETSVDFKIKAASTGTDNSLNGRHTVNICE